MSDSPTICAICSEAWSTQFLDACLWMPVNPWWLSVHLTIPPRPRRVRQALINNRWVDRVTTEEVKKNRNHKRGQSGTILRARRRFNVSSSDRARTYAFKRIPSSKQEGDKPTSRGNNTESGQHSVNNTHPDVYNAGSDASIAGGVHAPAYGGGPAGCIVFVESRRERLQLVDEGSEGCTGIPIGGGAPSCTIDLRGGATRSFSSRLTNDRASIPPVSQRPALVSTSDDITRLQVQEGNGECETGLLLSRSTVVGRRQRYAVIGPENGATEQTTTTRSSGDHIYRGNFAQVAGNEPVPHRRVRRRRPRTPVAGGRRHKHQSEASEFNQLQSLLNASRQMLSETTTLGPSKDVNVDVSFMTGGQNAGSDPGTRRRAHRRAPIAKKNVSLHKHTPPADDDVVGTREKAAEIAEDSTRTADSEGSVKRNKSGSRNTESSADAHSKGIAVRQGRPMSHQLGTLKTEQSSRATFPRGVGGCVIAHRRKVRRGEANPNRTPNLRDVRQLINNTGQRGGAENLHAEGTTSRGGNIAVVDSSRPQASIAKSGGICEAVSGTAPVEASEAFLEGEAAAYPLTRCHDGVNRRDEDSGIGEDNVENCANSDQEETAVHVSTTAATTRVTTIATATSINPYHDTPGTGDLWAFWYGRAQHNEGGDKTSQETGAMVASEGGTHRAQTYAKEQRSEMKYREAGLSWYRAVPKATEQESDTNQNAMADGGWRHDEQSESWKFDGSAGDEPEDHVAQQPKHDYNETAVSPTMGEPLQQEGALPLLTDKEEGYVSTKEPTPRNRGTPTTSRVTDDRRQRGLRGKCSRGRVTTRVGATSRAVLLGNGDLTNSSSPKVSVRQYIGNCRTQPSLGKPDFATTLVL